MMKIDPLKNEFTKIFNWTPYQIDLVAKFLITIVLVKTVNLSKIAESFPGKALVASHYKRLQRFFRNFTFDQADLAHLVIRILPLEDSWILCLDRTNWKFGKTNINILMLAVSYKGIAVPLFWSFLDKRGNSNTSERIKLMDQFLEAFPINQINCLTADREFIGKKWIAYLLENSIPFRLRIRGNTQVPNSRGDRLMKATLIFRSLQIGEKMVLNKRRIILTFSLYLAAVRTSSDYVVILTNHKPHQALEDYGKRWQIETLFGCLKTRGFRFEDTHLSHLDRINNLLFLLTIAFCWCYRIGINANKANRIPIKKHGRLARSLFRKGLEVLTTLIINWDIKRKQFLRAMKLVSCT